MKLHNFGGATAILEHKGVRMLLDPWLDDGIFHGAWYHYPPLAESARNLDRVDYVYISHIHEDHCSLGTLRKVNRDAEIILMDRTPNFVAKFLEANGLKFKAVHLIKPRTQKELRPGLVASTLEADPANEMAHVVDSALLLRWDGWTIYNANDCQPYDGGLAHVKDAYGEPDIAMLPYSGGSGYPSCYVNLSDEQKGAEKKRILEARLGKFVDAVRKLNPKWVVPFADQYVVAGTRSHLNRYISHPSCPGAVADSLEDTGFRNRLALLNSGQSFDFDTRTRTPDEPYRFYSEEDRDRYISKFLLGKLYDHERFQFQPGIAVERLVEYARRRLWLSQKRKNFFPQSSIFLDLADLHRRFRIRLDQEEVKEVPWDVEPDAPYLRVSCGYTLMIMLLLGQVSWNIADAALFLDYDRMPNIYEPEIYVCLNLLKV